MHLLNLHAVPQLNQLAVHQLLAAAQTLAAKNLASLKDFSVTKSDATLAVHQNQLAVHQLNQLAVLLLLADATSLVQ